MTRALILLSLALAAVAGAAEAQAQALPQAAPPHASSAFDQHRYQADQHRFEMDRLRAGADQREIFARQQALASRLNRFEIEAARQPEPLQHPVWPALRSPEQERAAREAATRRREAVAAGVSQIDAWLDVPAD